MTGTPADFAVERILVAMDANAGPLAALDSLAVLAARLGAELRAVFVEDQDLVSLAELPLVSTVSTVSSARGGLEPASVARAFKARAGLGREAVERAGARAGIAASFSIRRGRVVDEIVAESTAADLLVLGWTTGGVALRPMGRAMRPGRTARRVAGAAPASVLLLRDGAAVEGPVLVAYDGSSQARRALAAAGGLAGGTGTLAEVVLLTHRPALWHQWHDEVEALTQGLDVNVHFQDVIEETVDQLCRAARHRHVGLMILEAGLPLLEGDGMERLLEKADCSVLVVR